MTEPTAGPEPTRGRPPGPRFLRSMPAPLMGLFLALIAGTVAFVLFLLINPPTFESVAIEDTRPAPAGALTHDVGAARPAPASTPAGTFTPPCAVLEPVAVAGGQPAVDRISAALRPLCRLTGPGHPPEVGIALEGLDGTTIRYAAAFDRSGVESVADRDTRTIFLNFKFARQNTPTIVMAPLVIHEAYHLALAGEPVTARRELGARTAELAACRVLILRDRWPRGCREADELVSLGEEAAIAALVDAGYPRG